LLLDLNKRINKKEKVKEKRRNVDDLNESNAFIQFDLNSN